MRRPELIRVVIVAGLITILLQIWLLPPDQSYFDFVLIEPRDEGYQLINTVYVENNETQIYPFVRNVMGSTHLIRLTAVGLQELGMNASYATSEVGIQPQHTWILQNNEPAKTEDYSSHWEIVPLTVDSIQGWMNYLNITLSYFKDQWLQYTWISIQLVHS